MLKSQKASTSLHIKCITWYKDSHSLFDYESTKVTSFMFDFSLSNKIISVFRRRDSKYINQQQIIGGQTYAVQQNQASKYQNQSYQLLTRFNTTPITDKKIKLKFTKENQTNIHKKQNQNQRLNTDQSNSSQLQTQQETYLIVRKLKKQNGDYLGYKLQPGHVIKIGRVEFFVSQICLNGKVTSVNQKNKTKIYSNRKVMKYNPNDYKTAPNSTKPQQQIQCRQCKICLQQTEQPANFLFNPCKCSGSCGTVHLQCLTQWIHFKVKKQVVGGTQHYNFQKFKCQVCKQQLPMILQITGQQKHKQLLPIEKPNGNYIILEGACDKEKSVIMIQNVPTEGIKLGRGHQCQIRITDISVSRSHGIIKNHVDGFYIFDNKSKFGTLIRQDNMEIQLGRISQGIQIGRTVVSFQLKSQTSSKNITNKRFVQHKE